MYSEDIQPRDKLTIQSELIKSAVLFLSDSCDGAQATDGIGFNGVDSEFGNSLAQATRKYGELTPPTGIPSLETMSQILAAVTQSRPRNYPA